MVYTLIIILWVIYSSLFGYCDAWYWYGANTSKYSVKGFIFKDLHPHYFWMRSIVGSVFAYTMCDGTFLDWFLITVCLGMLFPFFHNGFFYKTRHEIDNTKYPLGFRDMSTTSIANVNFTFLIRSIMLGLGILGLTIIKIL
jgi:hypothetical protein